MRKKIVFCFLLLSVLPCCNVASKRPIVIEDESYGPNWVGPGLYWGMYISNEDEYWRYYDQRYPQNRKNRGLERGGRRAGNGRDDTDRYNKRNL